MFFLLLGCFGDERKQPPISISGQTMGTTYNITVVDNPLNLSKEILKKRVGETLADINNKMSNWYDQSEISSVNNNTGRTPIDLSQELFDVINIAKDINIKSDGAFDVTSASLINLWGFGPNKSEKKIPTES
jgi:thiamine biosynthesis lipoprotein